MPKIENPLQIKDLKIALKDLEKMVKYSDEKWRSWLINWNNSRKSWNNIPIEWGGVFHMRPREAWANWLFCACSKKAFWIDVIFRESEDWDWLIVDKESWWFIITEHVAAMNFPWWKKIETGEDRIISAIEHKIKKWEKYAENKFLIVFSEGAWKWYPNKVAKAISGKHNFQWIYCISLLEISKDGSYSYSISQFLVEYAPTYCITINSDFSDWKVEKIQ